MADKKTKDLNINKINYPNLGISLMILAVGVFIGLLSARDHETRTAATYANGQIFNVGDKATVPGVFDITVTKVLKNVELAQQMHLPEDQKILVLDVTFNYASNKELTFTPLLETYLRDAEGSVYNLTPDISQPALLPKDMKKGESNQGKLTFIVPNRNIPYYFYFDTGWANRGPVEFFINQ